MQQCYFWTFTHAYSMSPKASAKIWNRFRISLCRALQKRGIRNFKAIRVTEPHDINNEIWHGVHYHCICNLPINIDMVRALWNRANQNGTQNRLEVKKVKGAQDKEDTRKYLCKYLTKTARDRVPCLKGMRLWNAFGTIKGWATKVKSVHVQCLWDLFWCEKAAKDAPKLAPKVTPKSNHPGHIEEAEIQDAENLTIFRREFYAYLKKMQLYFALHLSELREFFILSEKAVDNGGVLCYSY